MFLPLSYRKERRETMNETWRPVVGYEDLYEVSNKGQVRSKENRKVVQREGQQSFARKYGGKVLHNNVNMWGYLQVSLSKDGVRKTHTVHRLVMEAFVPNPNKLPCINHIDENKQNNDLRNLEWCTYQYNCNYGTARERCISKQTKPVLQICDGVVVKRWESTNEAGRNGYTQSSVSQCCRGLRKSHKGYEWRFENGF